MRNIAILTLAILTLVPGSAKCDVADSTTGGFIVKIIFTVKAPPAEVYRKLIHDIGEWWDSAHTYSGSSHNLSIEEKPMGCFCERLPDGGGVRHLEVVYLAPGKALGLSGALGPLQSIAAAGNMVIQLSPTEGGTKLILSYSVVGYQPAGMKSWAAPVDSMLTAQFTRLRNYVEHGNPDPAK